MAIHSIQDGECRHVGRYNIGRGCWRCIDCGITGAFASDLAERVQSKADKTSVEDAAAKLRKTGWTCRCIAGDWYVQRTFTDAGLRRLAADVELVKLVRPG
ncbi:MAG: hypothetical protein WD078_08770 [Woeseia sp.]